MTKPVVLLGGGAHARVVAEAIRSRSDLFELRGFVDPSPCEETISRLGIKRLGGDDALVEHRDAGVVMGIGALPTSARVEDIIARIGSFGPDWTTVIHADARVSETAGIGRGCVVMAGAIVQTGASLGSHVLVNTGALVDHDVTLGDFAYVAPGAAIAGGVKVGRAAYLGLGCRIREYITIGERSIIGMGAVVVRDVPAGARVMGVPAK